MVKIKLPITFLASVSLALLGSISQANASQDWIFHSVPIQDSRPRLPKGVSKNSKVAIIEIPYQSPLQIRGAMLMIPGLFETAHAFDLLPEQDVSVARYFMKRFGLKIYLLHIRGLHGAGHSKKLNLDDFGIDDLPAAIQWVYKREKAPIFTFGNSQGAVMLQASLAGLKRCPEQLGNCFSQAEATKRQKMIQGFALSAGSLSMTSQDPNNLLSTFADLGSDLEAILRKLDYIPIRDLIENPLLSRLAHSEYWKFLYLKKNVKRSAEQARYEKGFEASWAGVLLQFGNAIHDRGIRTISKMEPEWYTDALKNITVPVVQVTYTEDPFAEPIPTHRDSFCKIGSGTKGFFSISGQAHEDYMMSSQLHRTWQLPMAWLLRHTQITMLQNEDTSGDALDLVHKPFKSCLLHSK